MENIIHQKMMILALREAEKAAEKGEVPVGAVITNAEGDILASSHNQVISRCDPTAHAEILAIRQLAKDVRNYRLLNTTLYVTIEPCVMCMGAIIHARMARIVFGAWDPKWGGAGSLYDFSTDQRLNHQPELVSGICRGACSKLLQDFFRARRKKTVISSSDRGL